MFRTTSNQNSVFGEAKGVWETENGWPDSPEEFDNDKYLDALSSTRPTERFIWPILCFISITISVFFNISRFLFLFPYHEWTCYFIQFSEFLENIKVFFELFYHIDNHSFEFHVWNFIRPLWLGSLIWYWQSEEEDNCLGLSCCCSEVSRDIKTCLCSWLSARTWW